MKNFSRFSRYFTLLVIAVCGIIIFQGQEYYPYPWGPDDTNPLIDQPTREAFTHFRAPSSEVIGDVVTDATGFDNFNISVDYCEQNMTIHPTNPLWMFFGVNGSGSPQNAYWTTNGGLNWTLNNPAYPSGTCCDPWSAYTGSGVLIYGSGVNGQYVYRSTNNGQTWTTPVLSVTGNDRNTLAAEATGTGPYANYVYAAITPGNFARSTDLGATWTQTYTSSNTVPGVMIAVGPHPQTKSRIAVVYVTNTGSTVPCVYNFKYSVDGGLTFQNGASLDVAGYVGTLNSAGRLVINNARTRPYPMIAMDNCLTSPYAGRLYLVYASNNPAGNGNHPDIKLQYSDNLGINWSSWVKVNDNVEPTYSDQWFPAVWCEKTTGKLYIKWYDTRENPANFTTGVWGTYSTNGGQSFAVNQRISNASWSYPCPTCAANSNCYRGDYDAIVANPDVGYAVWWDPRNCGYDTYGSYFPDYAERVIPSTHNIGTVNDSDFSFVSVPAVKLYTNKVKFSATVTPPPTTGTITLSFLNKTANTLQDSLMTYPDSVRIRIKTTGINAGTYTVNIKSNGPNGTPVHMRTITLTAAAPGLNPNSDKSLGDIYGSKTDPSLHNQNNNQPTPTVSDGTPLYTDNFDGANDTTALKSRGYKVYYRGSGAQWLAPTWFSPINPPPFNAYNGANVGYVAANYRVVSGTNNIDSWLVLPRIAGGIAVGDTLVFYCRGIIGSQNPDSIRVMYTTTDSIPEGTWTELGRFKTNTTTGWEKKSFRAPTASANARFAIRYSVVNGGPNGPNSDFVAIDALTIERYFVGISKIGNEVPENFKLYQNFPNPFNPSTSINFDISKSGNVKVNIYDVSGKEIKTLVNNLYQAGKYSINFNASELSSGIYFYRIETPEFSEIKKMILVK